MTFQEKMVSRICKEISFGRLEPVQEWGFANKGVIRAQVPDSFITKFQVSLDFQPGSFHAKIFTWKGPGVEDPDTHEVFADCSDGHKLNTFIKVLGDWSEKFALRTPAAKG